jgi:transposase
MAKRLSVASHLAVDEIGERYRRCKDVVEKSRWHVVWLKSQKFPTGEVARIVGFNTDWIRRVVHRYNQLGPNALKDGRAHNGRSPLLSADEQQVLIAALSGPAPDGGLWNSVKVAQWISERIGRRVRFQRGWVYLRRLNWTLQIPRPRHVEASEEAQTAFKKTPHPRRGNAIQAS